jgi:tripartite-type tricarboxylate transporter receptor subunit TctC
MEYIRAGKLRASAVTTAARSDALRDIPAMADFVPGYEASGWFGVGKVVKFAGIRAASPGPSIP